MEVGIVTAARCSAMRVLLAVLSASPACATKSAQPTSRAKVASPSHAASPTSQARSAAPDAGAPEPRDNKGVAATPDHQATAHTPEASAADSNSDAGTPGAEPPQAIDITPSAPPPKPDPCFDNVAAGLDAQTRSLLEELARLQSDTPTTEQGVSDDTGNFLGLHPTYRRALPRMKLIARTAVTQMLTWVPMKATDCNRDVTDLMESVVKELGVQTYDRSGVSWGGWEAEARPVLDLSVHRPPKHSKRWLVSIAFNVPCGNDTSLYLFAEKTPVPTLEMAIEKNGYKWNSEALHHAVGHLSPPDGQGRYFLVVLHGSARCGPGIGRGVGFLAYRPGWSPEHPKLLADGGAWNRGDGPWVDVSEDEFTVRIYTWDTMAGFPRNRNHVRRFKAQGARFVRVKPYAADPSGFVDEWVRLPWKEAARLSDPRKLGDLAKWHWRIKAAMKYDKSASPDPDRTELAGEQSGQTGHTEVKYRCPNCKKLPGELTFDVAPSGDGYVLKRIEGKP